MTKDPKKRLEAQRRYRAKHREKCNAKQREWIKKNPEKAKAIRRKCFYGLTDEDFKNIIARQNNQCKLCGKEFTFTPSVDHNHDTKQIRGLLCRSCNSCLAWFENKKDKVLEYLK